MFAHAEVVVNEREERLSVPLNALVVFAGIEKVIAVKDGKAVEKTVTTGRRGTDWIEIVSGAVAGEIVVLDPTGIRTGQPVKVENPAEPPAASTKTSSGQ